MRPLRPLLFILCALFSLAHAASAPAQGRAGADWAGQVLANLTLEEKAAQLLMIRAAAVPKHPDSPEHRALLREVRELKVGGVVLFRSELDSIPLLLDELQAASKLPLWFGADVERSLGMRVPAGPVSLPDAMAIGAIPGAAGIEAARFAGELTARETRAAGIHWAFAPVADVNSNPANPIINLRSFGEDPVRVAALVAAFVEGAKSAGGVLTAAKHFPGHGDTAEDSHLELPSIDRSRAELDRVELAPFRAAIAAGVDSIMVGHLAVPAVDATGAPATLSPAISSGLLRHELGFDGLIVTDAMDMSGVGGVWIGEATVRAVEAGADVVLLPPDPRVALQSLVRAVREGRLSESRLDESARRVLEAKARLGLHRDRRVDRAALRDGIGRPPDAAQAEEIALRAVTLVRDEGGLLPLRAEESQRILHLVTSSDWINGNVGGGGGIAGAELERRGVEVATRRIGPQLSPAVAEEIAAQARDATHVLVSAFVRVTSSKGNAEMDPTHAALIERLVSEGARLVVVSYGSPYLLRQFPSASTYLCTFSPEESSQRAAIAALFGESAIGGRLPVTIPGVAAAGGGLDRPRRELTLGTATAAEAGFTESGLAEVDRIVRRFVDEKAFPGAVLAIGRHGKLVHLRAFGKLSYDAGAAAVRTDTIYDIASLTKVVVTTTLAMQLVDEKRLDLDARVQDYLPELKGSNKEKVRIRHLLTHSSGIDWWAPLYEELARVEAGKRKAAALARIQAMDLVYEPGTETKYSDLGILLLGEILERASGRSLAELAQERLFEPLGLERSTYNPLPSLFSNVAPTEIDPESQRPLHGVVHDENARALGGVAPHAGLFSTAGDLAKFAQMLLWHGVYDHRRIVSKESVEAFTARQELPPGSSRALGWDTKSEEGSSAGVLFSPRSYGHTGFTGTSLWIDPERELFVVLLTNRVHPTRDGSRMGEARPAIHDAIVRALVDAPPVVRVGLDRVDAGEPEALGALAGKRLGLLSHAASVTLDGRRAVDVLRERKLNVVRLFSPEHGLRGQAAAGEKVADAVDAATGLPVVSLYGEHTKPTPDDLAGLDALVVDLQDAGVRFYTYASSLMLCLEAAAEAGIELIVLDRPNPLGGERVGGPFVSGGKTLLTMAPGTLLHGLTLGEMARHANVNRELPAKLTVVAMAGWKRRMTWRDTGRRWVAPSPNLRSAAAAIAYPGVALLEGTNVSEGRGTDKPFLLFGAPWLDTTRVTIEAPGFRLKPTHFTPRASAAAPDPKYRDVECAGFEIEVVDSATADPWRLGSQLIATLDDQPGFELLRGGEALVALTGQPRILEHLRRGGKSSPRSGHDSTATANWRQWRTGSLLYD